jgi:hypothetical protein
MSDENSKNRPIEPKNTIVAYTQKEACASLRPNVVGDLDDVRNLQRAHTAASRIIVGTESYPSGTADYWRAVEKDPWVLGDFVWTGMDYIGEAGLGAARVGNERNIYFDAYCGDLDICGFKKAPSYYRDVVWGRSELEMFMHRPIPPGQRESVAGWGWPD